MYFARSELESFAQPDSANFGKIQSRQRRAVHSSGRRDSKGETRVASQIALNATNARVRWNAQHGLMDRGTQGDVPTNAPLFACRLSASEAFLFLSGVVCWVLSNAYTQEEHLLVFFLVACDRRMAELLDAGGHSSIAPLNSGEALVEEAKFKWRTARSPSLRLPSLYRPKFWTTKLMKSCAMFAKWRLRWRAKMELLTKVNVRQRFARKMALPWMPESALFVEPPWKAIFATAVKANVCWVLCRHWHRGSRS